VFHNFSEFPTSTTINSRSLSSSNSLSPSLSAIPRLIPQSQSTPNSKTFLEIEQHFRQLTDSEAEENSKEQDDFLSLGNNFFDSDDDSDSDHDVIDPIIIQPSRRAYPSKFTTKRINNNNSDARVGRVRRTIPELDHINKIIDRNNLTKPSSSSSVSVEQTHAILLRDIFPPTESPKSTVPSISPSPTETKPQICEIWINPKLFASRAEKRKREEELAVLTTKKTTTTGQQQLK